MRVESAVVDGFDPADALTAEARHRGAAFVAVASHGRTGLARAVLGSVAVATVRKASCPVLVSGPAVHRHAADDNGQKGRYCQSFQYCASCFRKASLFATGHVTSLPSRSK